MTKVYLLWHTNPKNEDEKLIGVFSTEDSAKKARLSVEGQSGFKDSPEGFEICPYELDRTEWREGYISSDEV